MFLVATLLAGALVAGCGFEPDIDPLVLATAPANPFSAFAPDTVAFDSISPVGVVAGLVLATLGLFSLNFDLAYSVYVYRVSSAPLGEEVRPNLRFWEGWGLSSPDEGK
jgi:hypothetical protein